MPYHVTDPGRPGFIIQVIDFPFDALVSSKELSPACSWRQTYISSLEGLLFHFLTHKVARRIVACLLGLGQQLRV